MSKTIEISRELAERLASCAEAYVDIDDADLIELRALIAAPMVERQEPVEIGYIQHSKTFNSEFAPVDNRLIWTMPISQRHTIPQNYKVMLYTSPPAPVAVVMPRYTCIGKGGEYELLGSAIGAGTLKDMSAIPVYRDTTTGQLFVRTPLDFSIRMACLDKVKELNQ